MNDFCNKYENRFYKRGEQVPLYVDGKEVKKVVDVVPNYQKSYYGKARELHTKNKIYLLSYDTLICVIDTKTHRLKKLWDGYSATTSKHLHDFLINNGFSGYSKKEWFKLPFKYVEG